MEPKMSDHVNNYVKNLFERGCQVYDRVTKTKENEGGAAFFYILNWRIPNGTQDINIENEGLFTALKSAPAISVYAGDRILTDEDGDKLPLEDESKEGFQHGWSCLFVYSQMADFNSDISKILSVKIVDHAPELKGAIEPLANYREFLASVGALVTVDNIDYVKGAFTRNAYGQYEMCKLRGMVIILFLMVQ